MSINKDVNFEQMKAAYAECSTPAHSATVGQNSVQTVQYSTNGWGGYGSVYPSSGYSYPVYIDRTQKAFAIAKWLMDSKLVSVKDVPAFITLINGLIQHV